MQNQFLFRKLSQMKGMWLMIGVLQIVLVSIPAALLLILTASIRLVGNDSAIKHGIESIPNSCYFLLVSVEHNSKLEKIL